MSESLRLWLESLARCPGDPLLIWVENKIDVRLEQIRLRVKGASESQWVELPLIASLESREARLVEVPLAIPETWQGRVPVQIEAHWHQEGRRQLQGPLFVEDFLEVLPSEPQRKKNPFTTSPLSPETPLFVGREQERENLIRSLREDGKRAIWVVDGRSLGKTSFVRCIPQWLGEYRWLYVGCRQVADKMVKAIDKQELVTPLSVESLISQTQPLRSPKDDNAPNGLILDDCQAIEVLRSLEDAVDPYFFMRLAERVKEQDWVLILTREQAPEPSEDSPWDHSLLPGSNLAMVLSLEPLSREAVRLLAQQAPFHYDQSLLNQSPAEADFDWIVTAVQAGRRVIWVYGDPILRSRFVERLPARLSGFHWLHLTGQEVVKSTDSDLEALLQKARVLSPGPDAPAPKALVLDNHEATEQLDESRRQGLVEELKRFAGQEKHLLVLVGKGLPQGSSLWPASFLPPRQIAVQPQPLGSDEIFEYSGGHPMLAQMVLAGIAWEGLKKGYVTRRDLMDRRYEIVDTYRYDLEHLWAGLTWLERRVLIACFLRQERRSGGVIWDDVQAALSKQYPQELPTQGDIQDELKRMGGQEKVGKALRRDLFYGHPATRIETVERVKRLIGQVRQGLDIVVPSPLWGKRPFLERHRKTLADLEKSLERELSLLKQKGIERQWDRTLEVLEKKVVPNLRDLYRHFEELSQALQEFEQEVNRGQMALAGEFSVEEALDFLVKKGMLVREPTGYWLPRILFYRLALSPEIKTLMALERKEVSR